MAGMFHLPENFTSNSEIFEKRLSDTTCQSSCGHSHTVVTKSFYSFPSVINRRPLRNFFFSGLSNPQVRAAHHSSVC